MSLRTVIATRYVTPFREGGSLPAVEADGDGMYVLKFRSAGQGPKALIAELVAGQIDRASGLPVPEIVFVDLDGELARTEPDPEIQALIRPVRASTWPSTPARRGDLRSDCREARLGAGVFHRLVRCLCLQCRPHAAQLEHSGVAPAPLAD